MFTGIIQHRAKLAAATRVAFGMTLEIDASGWDHAPAHGESICVSGVCLTCTSDRGIFTFDVIAQTLECTTLGSLSVGDAVNLEPCLRPDSLLSGHIVQGHVDGVGTVEDVKTAADEVRITIRPPEHLLDYIVPKGSVAVDGVSMTLAAVHPETFELALIPTTLELTTLGLVKPGSRVNLETDILAKTIVHLHRRMYDQEDATGADHG
ncbi:MAG: riboflavin synthase [Planctomycetes bacterium]|nr:riboflavin synthase [Planctomycetota bacterium]